MKSSLPPMKYALFRLVPLTVLFAGLFCRGPASVSACTTAVLSGRCTADGRPLLWKHRDTDAIQNRLGWFTDGRYMYLALLDTKDTEGKNVWAGINETGFAVMNSDSQDLNPEPDGSNRKKDQEGVVMRAALRTCATVDDFEQLLKEWPRPMGVGANFGAIDARGGAAFFETSNTDYVKIDVSDPDCVPAGYMIRSNFASTGRKNAGTGYIRYQTAKELFAQAAARNDLTPRFLIKKASRCLKHSLTCRDLRKEGESLPSGGPKWVFFRDYVPRICSASAIAFQGVKREEDPRLCTAWTILGFPLTSVAVPAWVGAAPELPRIVLSDRSAPTPLCDLSVKLKQRCFLVPRGNEGYYLNLPRLINSDGTGLLQRLDPIENRVLNKAQSMTRRWRREGLDPEEAKAFYHWMDTEVFDEIRSATRE